MRVYTIRDQAGEFFLPPFTAHNDAIAKRMFVGSMGDSFSHRMDFVLYFVGEFSDENGTLSPVEPVVVLAGYSVADSLDPRPRPEPQPERVVL